MSKYIIELDDTVKAVQKLSVLGDGSIYNHLWEVEELEELNSEYIKDNFGQLLETAYQKGLEDGKAQSEKGCVGCMWEDKEYNTCSICCNSYKNMYEAKKTDDEIKVGDEMTDLQSGANFVVTHLWKNNHGEMGVSGFNGDCFAFSATFNKVKKTGRHFPIDKILEEMKNKL